MTPIAILFMSIGFGVTVGGLIVTLLIDFKHTKDKR